MPQCDERGPAVAAVREARCRLAVHTAVIAGIFSLLVLVLLGWDYHRRLTKDPLESPEFQSLKAALTKDPRNEDLKAKIRDLDLHLREAYFRQRSFAGSGAALLAIGLVTLLASARWAVMLRRRLPTPVARSVPQDPEIRMAQIGRWAVGAVGIVMMGVAVALSQGFRSELPRDVKPAGPQIAAVAPLAPSTAPTTVAQTGTSPAPAAPAKTQLAAATPAAAPSAVAAPAPATAAGDYPSDEELRKNWPRFRGHDGSGITTEKGILTAWSGADGKGIVWKTAVPLPGHNSPIIWGDRLFLSGATEEKRQVFCFNLADGKLLWQKDLPGTPESTKEPPKIMEDTGFAAPTMATDGRRVYAMFANGDVGAMDFQGNVAWARSLGIPHSSYGHSASLATYKNILVIQYDQGEAKENLSKIYGLDSATGKLVWNTPRPVPNTWSSPVVVRTGDRDQLLTNGEPWVISYDPANGKELWRVNCLRMDVGPSPVLCNGMVYAANQSPCVAAIRVDGQGDVTKTHVAWQGEDNLPDTSSPLATDEYLFLLTSSGTLTSYDAKKGKKLWEKDFEASFKASPSLVGKLLYVLSDEGKMWIVEPGPKECKEVGMAELGEPCAASPAFHNGRMFLRGEKNVYSIGEK